MVGSKMASVATITDVAGRAGVSIKTVSRVMNREEGVRPDTRERVLAAVAELRYRPKQSARSLAGGKSFLIGLLYYDPSAAFVGSVQQGATLRCREAGYHLVVESLHNDAPDLERQIDRMVSALLPDGMILTPPLCDNAQVLQALRDAGTPYVLISPARDLKGVPSVGMDDTRAAEEVTNLLISLGHQRIGFIRGAPDQAAAGRREQGYLTAMRTHGLDVDPELLVQGDFRFESGIEAAHRLLSRRSRPTAVFAANDDMALGLLAAAQRLGLRVPVDLSIAGFDDSAAASRVWPRLTTVRQPTVEMARAAVDLLLGGTTELALPRRAASGQHVFAHELVVRDSTAAPGSAGAISAPRERAGR